MNQQGKPVQVRVDGTPDYRVVQVGYRYQIVDANDKVIDVYDSHDSAFEKAKFIVQNGDQMVVLGTYD